MKDLFTKQHVRLLETEKHRLRVLLMWILMWKCVLQLCYNKDTIF